MRSLLLLFFFVFLFSVGNAQWVEQTSGVTGALYSVSAVDDNVCWAGGATGVVLRTVNGGTNWTNVGGAGVGSADVYAVFALDANTCWVTTSPATGAYIYKTTDGGASWTQQFFQSGGFGNGVWFKDANNGFFTGDPVGNRWSIFRTTNGGTTWDSTGMYQASGGAAGWNNSLFVSGNSIWYGTNQTKIWYSPDFGNTWQIQTTTGQANSYAVWFNNATTGLAGGTNFLATANGGTTWAAVTVPGTGNVSGITGEATNWYVIRQATGLYQSTDNGTTWTTAYTAPAGSFYHISKARTGTAIWACRSNGGIAKGWGVPVPVEFTSFAGTSDNGSVNLSWATATETNNKGFEVQRRFENTEFATIAFIDGKGTTTGSNNYAYTDSKIESGKYFYRLRQIDFDGTFAYSNEIEVDVVAITSFALDQNYPNPFNPSTSISYRLPEASDVVVKIFDVMGNEVATLVNGRQDAGAHQVVFDAAKLSSGSYIYSIKAGNFSATKKMILMK